MIIIETIAEPKTNNIYTTETHTHTYRGHTYNVSVTANEISIEAIRDLCRLILKTS